MTIFYAIYYEGRQYGEVLPQTKAIAKHRELSACLKNLDLRIVDRKDVQLKAVR